MAEPLRVLHIEDSPTDAKLVLRALGSLGRPIVDRRVEDRPGMLEALGSQTWDVVLSDWSLPRLGGLEALEILKQSKLDVPFIIVSGTVTEESAVGAMRAGAHDYVLKDKLARLAPAIERELREAADRQALRSAEQSRRESDRRYQLIVETTRQGVVLTDPGGQVLFVNSRFGAMLGYAPAEAVGRHVRDFIGESSRAASEEFRLAHRPPTAGEERLMQCKDGRQFWARGESNPILNEAGEYQGRLTMFSDVTDQLRDEVELATSQARLTRLNESGIMGISINSRVGPVLEANDAFLAMLGYTREDLAAGTLDWSQLTPPEWQQVNDRIVDDLKQSGRSGPQEKEYFRKDGSRVPVMVGVAALDANHTISISVDLSDRKEAEKKLRQTEEQLRHAQKMEAVGRLAGGVAHDFNNLLSVILSYTHMLLAEAPSGSGMRDDLEEVSRAGKRAADLTRQLLQFSRQRAFDPAVIDPRDTLASMDKMLRRVLGEDIELECRTAGSTGLVRADPTGFEQVIMNLVVNARDAMPTGGSLTLELSDVALDADFAKSHVGVVPGPHVQLSVTDTGVGMDAATQNRIFEPFFTTKEMGKGTGLGLSTVFGIVQQSGGTVWVCSEPGKGTTFQVYLPLVTADPDEARPEVAPLPRPGVETILLVEDADQVRAVARSILVRQGYRVLEASSGAEALSLAERHPEPIHLLLSDVVMPQMSGPSLAERLRQARPAIRVLCMSGYSDDSAVRHGLVEGGLPFIQKPFTPDSLARKVREVLDHAPPRPPSRGTALAQPRGGRE